MIPIIFAMRNCSVFRSKVRSICSLSRLENVLKVETSSQFNTLHVGVLGLGAIGTIFFTKLGLLATNYKTKRELPQFTVDAFVRPQQLENWMKKGQFQLSLERQQKKETLRFQMTSDERVATVVGGSNVHIRTLQSAKIEPMNKLDVLLLTVKAYDSTEVIRELYKNNRHMLKNDALCVLLQNGPGEVPEIGDEDSKRVDTQKWHFANGVTYVGGRVVEFGTVLTSGLEGGMTYLAPFQNFKIKAFNDFYEYRLFQNKCNASIEKLAQLFIAAGLRCKILEKTEMKGMLWRKLIINAAINPLASILNASNSSVAVNESCRQCVYMVVHEAYAVAKSVNISLDCSQDELVDEIFDVARSTGSNVCSMLADLRHGSRTEIDALNGHIVAKGERHGIPTPVNRMLVLQIKALETERTRIVKEV
ncbi:uncharacterized protein CCR75_002727 [Bremia lactucae]|uniref:2-dehydropantoate 2-reductase n=1 Tax=Bremia lactucae TaxID=4779 RepID=A0A976FGM4_BRELC|nr:hypothetical protein CCR75_002727 [Bremia lactucae]